MDIGYSERVTLRAKLLAQLVFELIESKTQKYEEIRIASGVSRTKLEYVVKNWEKDPVPMKLEVFTKLLRWFELGDFPRANFTAQQRELCANINSTFQKRDSDRVYGAFTKGFQLHPAKIKELSRDLSGYYLAFRFRGTSDLVMVGAITMNPDLETDYFTWSFKFKEGDRPWDDENPLHDWEMRTRVVRGYAAPHENVLTCLGRRDGSNEVHMLNLMIEDDPSKQIEFKGLLSSHSRAEAISRSVLLVRQTEINGSNAYELNDVIRDYNVDKLHRVTKNRSAQFRLPAEIKSIRKGLSIAPQESKFFLPEWFDILDRRK